MAASPKYRIKQTPTDIWSTRERLCLASSVLRSGDQNWVSVSKAIRPFGEPNRPPDWFSQKNCALQYSDLLEKVETPKRKRGQRGEIETPGDLIVRKLTLERIEELKKLIEEEQRVHKKLKKELEEVRSGQADDHLDEIWKSIQEEMRAKEAAVSEHQAWLREREAKMAAMKSAPKMVLFGVHKTKKSAASSRLTKAPPGGEIRRSSSQSELSEQESVVDSPLSETLSLEVEDVSSPVPPSSSSSSSHPEATAASTPTKPTPTTLSSPTTSSTSPLLTSLLRSPTPAAPASPSFANMMSTSPKEGSTPAVATSRPSSTPQSFFNPSSALATAAARQLAVATASTSSSPSPVTSIFPPVAKDAANPTTRSPVHGTQPLPSSSPISSAPTLTRLLEMPPSLPGKLPPLPIISSSCESGGLPSGVQTTVASLNSDTIVVDTVATKVIPAVVLPVAGMGAAESDALAVKEEEEDGGVRDEQEEEDADVAVVNKLQEEEEEEESIPAEEEKEEEEEEKEKGQHEEEDDEQKPVVELMDVIQETEVTNSDEQHVVLIKEEIDVKEEVIEVPEMMETEVVEEEIVSVDIIEATVDATAKEDEEEQQTAAAKNDEPEDVHNDKDAAVEKEEEAAAMEVDEEGKEKKEEDAESDSEKQDAAAASAEDEKKEEEGKKEEEAEDVEEEEEEKDVSEKEVSQAAEAAQDEKDAIEDRDAAAGEKQEEDEEHVPEEAKKEEESCAPQEEEEEDKKMEEDEEEQVLEEAAAKDKKEEEEEEDKSPPAAAKEDANEVKEEATVEKVAEKETQEAVSEAPVAKNTTTQQKKVPAKRGRGRPPKVAKEQPESPASTSPSASLEATGQGGAEKVCSSDDKDAAAVEGAAGNEKPQEGAPPPPTSAEVEAEEDEDVDRMQAEITSLEGAESKEVYKRPKAGGKQGTTKEEVAQMQEVDGEKIVQTPSSATGDSIPNSPASVSQSDDQESIRDYKVWKKAIMLVWRAAATHKYANVFLHPVTNDVAPGYHSIVYRPMDLSTIKKNIETGAIKTTLEFQRDMMLMFQNAIMYNSSDHDVFHMAIEMQKEVMEHIQDFLATQLMVQTTESKSLRVRGERERKAAIAVTTDDKDAPSSSSDDRRKRTSVSDGESRGKKRRSRADE